MVPKEADAGAAARERGLVEDVLAEPLLDPEAHARRDEAAEEPSVEERVQDDVECCALEGLDVPYGGRLWVRELLRDRAEDVDCNLRIVRLERGCALADKQGYDGGENARLQRETSGPQIG